MREIKIYTTTGVKGKVINSDATTYGALKPSLRENNISLENMQVVIAGTGVSLEMDSASLPEGNFVLYFNPSTKIKSGEVTRNEIKAFIQANPNLKDKFSKDGRNWTQVSTVDLQAIYAKVSKQGTKVEPVKGTSKVTAKVVATPVAKKVVAKSTNNVINTIDSSEVIKELDNLYEKIDNCDDSDFEDNKSDILDMINCIKTKIQSVNLTSGSSDNSEDAAHLAEMKRLFGK